MIEYELLQKLYSIDTFVGYSDAEIQEMSEGFDDVPAALTDFWKNAERRQNYIRH